METRHLSSRCLVPPDDDFLSRYVNLEWDAEESEWNDHRDEFPDILSSEFIFSREHSHEEFYEDVKHSRKSSLEKPVGSLMQMKPRALIVCENFKSSSWGKFLKSERKHRDSSQGYPKENTACNNKVNIEKTRDKNNGRRSKCHLVASACKRSKSVNDVLEDSPGEVEPKPKQKQSLKKEWKEEKARGAANRFAKQFSVYSQSFELNTRFLSKSHHMSYWKPEKSRVKTRLEHPTSKKDPILDVAVEKRTISKKGDNERTAEVEATRRRRTFNTDKYYRSWVWEPEDSPSSKPKIFGKTDQNAQNSSTKSSKMYSTEFTNRKTRYQRISKKRKKTPGSFRQMSESDTAHSSTVSLPAISSQNISSVSLQRTPHKLGHIPCIFTDNLTKQYKKYHDEFVKQKNNNNKNKQNT